MVIFFGFIDSFIWFIPPFTKITNLETLSPPAVDPAHPPININIIITDLENKGHVPKSADT